MTRRTHGGPRVFWRVASGIVLLSCIGVARADERMLCSFTSAADLQQWEVRSGRLSLASLPGHPGVTAARLDFDAAGRYQPGYLTWRRVVGDWSGFDALVLEVTNPGTTPLPGYVLVADSAWAEAGRTYWNRHNGSTVFPPGTTEWVIPVRGMYRGEAGSRNNDIGRNIDPDSIVRLDFGFGAKGHSGRVYVRAMRLVRSRPPAGVWAFDFGPPSQSVMLGWTPVSHKTVFDARKGFGWGPKGGTPWNGAARDTTFGPMLTRDFCESRNSVFRVRVPPGRYTVYFVLENCGYWGGEQAKHRWRRLRINDRVVWEEKRPDGPAHALYRFEDVEPLGGDLWTTYMQPEITRMERIEVTTKEPELRFRFEADVPWACKVAGLVLFRRDDQEAAAWFADQEALLAKEFRQHAVCLDPPPVAVRVADSWKARGLAAWPVDLADTVVPASQPPADLGGPDEMRLRDVLAVRGEYEPVCVAVRPLRDLGECLLSVEGSLGEGVEASVGMVYYNTSRGFNTIAYRIRPHTLRPVDRIPLRPEVTRQLVVTLSVGSTAEPGRRDLALVLRSSDGGLLVRLPFTLTVSSVLLDRETPFLMGFFGLLPPSLLPAAEREKILEQTLDLLRQHGMNAVSGGPNWRLTGWHDGQPVLDTKECERFFAVLHRHGFDNPINGYGGLRFLGLHDRYVRGRTADKVAKESGLPYDTAFMRAWQALDARARAANWPTMFTAMCDETRVRDQAEKELDFMKLMARVTRRFPATVQASGSYSVSFNRRPEDKNDMLYWHQRFFEVLDINSLNSHDPSVLREAKRLGKSVHIYNQGRTRYSFGLYQWSEYRKGIKARWQWHLNILHGYQFFDLDGREPDTAMICYGRQAIYPTVHFERCREGAEDFYLYNTVMHLAEAGRRTKPGSPAVAAAAAFLRRLDDSVALNQRTPPPGYDPAALKAEAVKICEWLSAMSQ